jgi:hypothetical protein
MPGVHPCPCDCGSCKVCLVDCMGNPLVGAVVEVRGPAPATTLVDTVTTGADGCATAAIADNATYEFNIAWSGLTFILTAKTNGICKIVLTVPTGTVRYHFAVACCLAAGCGRYTAYSVPAHHFDGVVVTATSLTTGLSYSCTMGPGLLNNECVLDLPAYDDYTISFGGTWPADYFTVSPYTLHVTCCKYPLQGCLETACVEKKTVEALIRVDACVCDCDADTAGWTVAVTFGGTTVNAVYQGSCLWLATFAKSAPGLCLTGCTLTVGVTPSAPWVGASASYAVGCDQGTCGTLLTDLFGGIFYVFVPLDEEHICCGFPACRGLMGVDGPLGTATLYSTSGTYGPHCSDCFWRGFVDTTTYAITAVHCRRILGTGRWTCESVTVGTGAVRFWLDYADNVLDVWVPVGGECTSSDCDHTHYIAHAARVYWVDEETATSGDYPLLVDPATICDEPGLNPGLCFSASWGHYSGAAGPCEYFAAAADVTPVRVCFAPGVPPDGPVGTWTFDYTCP